MKRGTGQIVAIFVVLVFVIWFIQMRRAPMNLLERRDCENAYKSARTAADSALADARQPLEAARTDRHAVTCGELRKVGSTCPPIDTAAAWARTSRAWSNESGLRWSNDSLRRVLLALVDRDQAAREGFGGRITDSNYVKQLLALDSSLAATMTGILDRYGLPTKSMVGPKGSDAAMLIVQHNWSLQERVLAMAKSAPRGQISPEKLAMLEDRVLVHRGKPQRFGSQFSARPDGVFTFDAIADTTKLDARRAAAGMPPMRAYVCMMEEAGMRIDRTSLPASFTKSLASP